MTNELQIKEPDITSIQQRIGDLVEAASVLVVQDEESQKAAVVIRAYLKTELANVEAKEDEFTDPITQVLKKFRAIFKPAKDELANAIKTVDQKSTNYYVQQKEIEHKEQERLNKLAEKRFERNEASGKGNPLPVPIAPHVEIAQKKLDGATMIDKWTAVVTDLSKIPCYSGDGVQLMTPIQGALDKIGTASKGKAIIPGVRWDYTPYQRSVGR